MDNQSSSSLALEEGIESKLLGHKDGNNTAYAEEELDHVNNNIESVITEIQRSWVTNQEISSLGYLPSLDGLRAIALIGVMADHTTSMKPWNHMTGTMGVTVFFVLSGFLITGILLGMQRKSVAASSSRFGHLSHLPRFWAARVVRLIPALLVIVLVGSSYLYYRSRSLDKTLCNALRALFSLQNTPFFKRSGYMPFAFTWSLACEEQFYLIWAFLLPWLSGTALRRKICIGVLMCASIIVRIHGGNASHPHWLFNWNRSLLAVLYKMLAGASLQLLPFPRSLTKPIVAKLGLACLSLATSSAMLISEDPYTLFSLWADVLVTLGTVMIITGTLYSPNGLLMWTPLQNLGRISYAGYMWTSMIVAADATMFKGFPALADTALGLFCAMASTYWIEEPIRSRYRRAVHKS